MAKVLVPLAEGCEEIEAVTIIDLLRRAGIDVVVAGLKPGIVTASRGVQLVPDVTLDAALQHDYDMVVLPGGMSGAANLKDDARMIALLKKMAAAGRYTAAICAAPMVLAEAGLLDGKQATSYPGFL
ncbi:MAG: DJ-1 family protein, partial [Hydrogenophilales bacterium 16-62-9]